MQTSKIFACVLTMLFCCIGSKIYAQHLENSEFHDIVLPDYSFPCSEAPFRAVPDTAPWLLSSDPSFPYQPHGSSSSKKIHPALRSFLRFFIVSAGAMPITVGLSSFLYLTPPQGWSVTKQTQVILISGASAAVTIGFIDLIVDLVVQAKKKEALLQNEKKGRTSY